MVDKHRSLRYSIAKRKYQSHRYNKMHYLAGFSVLHELAFVSSAAASVAVLRDVIRTLGLAVLGLNLLGLFLHYVFSRLIRPEAERQSPMAPDQEVERYRKSTRILHWVNASTFSLLFLTGLAGYIKPDVFAAGSTGVRWLHQISAVIFIAAPLIYLLSNLKAARNGLKEAFTWGAKDIDWLIAIPRYYYLREEEILPPQGRLNTLQKLWWLLVIFLAPILVITGALMWVSGTNATAQWAAVLHDITFIFIGSMFMLHVYVSIVNPLVIGGRNESWQAMVTGKMSASYAKAYHRNWFEEMRQGNEAAPQKIQKPGR